MSESVSVLMLELLSWISSGRRTYDEAMEAWGSHCPRQTIWEDALIDGLIQVAGTPCQSEVTLTAQGRAILDEKNNRKSTQTDPPSRT
ncbi:MAG: hypothetical protein HY695_29875 [Deltaproteobacteria bacterium]|nr:hypothetical protein [Deltaproteobacteria bacterium]